ncbi:MAG: hypothetical protein CO187_08210 [Zetaproteobacteria bacterium CG_4_9_14_3_um_filter_53_7]|nr:MAG: hypothetical protein CO187_08210 [Zetaproteobacteria bacterium CG_4_9_14_3_um_filter_53_7]
MKIHNNLPVTGQSTQKTKQARSNVVFKSLLESEMTPIQQLNEQPQQEPQQGNEQGWQALQESISLLDQAMQCLESGDMPTTQIIDNIDTLRSQLRQQLASNTQSNELRDADTLLAVEAERMRSLQS